VLYRTRSNVVLAVSENKAAEGSARIAVIVWFFVNQEKADKFVSLVKNRNVLSVSSN
jgi:hypothetical protein